MNVTLYVDTHDCRFKFFAILPPCPCRSCCCMDRNPLPTQLLQPHDFQRWQRHQKEHKYELAGTEEANRKKLRLLIEEDWRKAVEISSTAVRDSA